MCIILVPGLLAGCTSSGRYSQSGEPARGFQREIIDTTSYSYLLFVPAGYETADKPWPLMIFLHGIGERGDDLELVKRHGPPKIVEQKKDFRFVLVSPQCPDDEWWSAERLDALLDEVVAKYGVDTGRIYLTGLSMGGFGAWDFACRFPHRFAAIAPICGGGNPQLACNLKDVPAWVFHGAKDKVVLIEKSEEMVNALRECGGNVTFTVYPEAEHDSWTQTYNNPGLYDWFLKQRKGS